MRDHADLLNHIVTVRERAETLQRGVMDHFRADSEIALSLSALIKKYQSIEADIRVSDARRTGPKLNQTQLNEIAEELSQYLGTITVFTDGLPRVFRQEKARLAS